MSFSILCSPENPIMKRQSTKSSEPPTETEGAAFHLFFFSRKREEGWNNSATQHTQPVLHLLLEKSHLLFLHKPPKCIQLLSLIFSLMIRCPLQVGEDKAEASTLALSQGERRQRKSRRNRRAVGGHQSLLCAAGC